MKGGIMGSTIPTILSSVTTQKGYNTNFTLRARQVDLQHTHLNLMQNETSVFAFRRLDTGNTEWWAGDGTYNTVVFRQPHAVEDFVACAVACRCAGLRHILDLCLY
jgi:hypothetical protein